MRVGVRSCYSVSRSLAKFHHVRSPFDAPTDNYSGNIAGLTSDVFGLRKQSSGLPLFSSLSSRPSTHPTTYRQVQPNLSRQPAASSRARLKIVPDPTRAVVTVVSGSSPNIYKTSPFSYSDFLVYFSRPLDFNWRDGLAPKLSLFPYIYILPSLKLDQP